MFCPCQQPGHCRRRVGRVESCPGFGFLNPGLWTTPGSLSLSFSTPPQSQMSPNQTTADLSRGPCGFLRPQITEQGSWGLGGVLT